MEATQVAESGVDAPFDIETVFRLHYRRVVRVIARVVRDQAHAEDIAVELFLKLWRNGAECPEGMLYRAAGRVAIDHLRREVRRARYERAVRIFADPPTPEQLHSAGEARERVRRALASIDRRRAAMLLLRSDGFSYDELASAFDLNPASVGALLSRAQQTFRKEYVRRYGNHE